MRLTIIIFIFIVFCQSLFAQDAEDLELSGKESSDHLWPVDNGYGKYYGLEPLTEKEIFAENEETNLEMIIYPSFSQPQRITVLENHREGLYRIALTTLKNDSRKISKDGKVRIKEITTQYRTLDIDTANTLNYLFEEVLIETKYSVNNKRITGMDGAIYQFLVDGKKYGVMFGETWSPRDGILPRILVDVSKLLEKYVNNEIGSEPLTTQLKTLKVKLEQKKKWRRKF